MLIDFQEVLHKAADAYDSGRAINIPSSWATPANPKTKRDQRDAIARARERFTRVNPPTQNWRGERTIALMIAAVNALADTGVGVSEPAEAARQIIDLVRFDDEGFERSAVDVATELGLEQERIVSTIATIDETAFAFLTQAIVDDLARPARRSGFTNIGRVSSRSPRSNGGRTTTPGASRPMPANTRR